jgi:hypothetical protein
MIKEFEKIIKYEDLCKLLGIDHRKFIVDIDIQIDGRGSCIAEGTTADSESEIIESYEND